MKIKFALTTIILTILLSLQSCAVVGGIFKAGTVTGIVIVVLIIAGVIFLLSKLFGGKK